MNVAQTPLAADFTCSLSGIPVVPTVVGWSPPRQLQLWFGGLPANPLTASVELPAEIQSLKTASGLVVPTFGPTIVPVEVEVAKDGQPWVLPK